MSSTPKLPKPETPLESALKYFKNAKSDEERFAVLMVLAKLGSPGDATVAREIHGTIGVRFLHRLLLSRSVPDGCSPDIFKGVSTSILAGLVQVPDIAASPDILELVEPLIDILTPEAVTEVSGAQNTIAGEVNPCATSVDVQVDTLEVLYGMVATPEGRARCLRCNLDTVLVQYLAVVESVQQTDDASQSTAAEPNGSGITRDTQGSTPMQPPVATMGIAATAAVRILTRLIEDADGSGMRCGSQRTTAGVTALARCFARRTDAAKFVAGGLLGGLLDVIRGTYAAESATVGALTAACDRCLDSAAGKGSRVPPSNDNVGFPEDTGTRTWVEWVAGGLQEVLQSRLDVDGRDMALRLAALTTEFCGGSIAWTLCARVPPAPSSHPNTTVPPLLPLLVQISRVELRMACEDRTLKQICPVARRVVCCLLVCEATISWLVALDEQEQTDVGSAIVVQLHSALQECIAAVLSMLDTACEEHYVLPPSAAGTQNDSDPSDTGDSHDITAGIIVAGVRLVSVWLAEESEALQDRVAVTLPFLLELGKQQTSPSSDLLRWLMPGLCNGTADDTLRSIVLHNEGIDLVLGRLQHEWLPELLTHRDLSVEIPVARTIATACQMLLNVIVLQPEYFRGCPASLCKRILEVADMGIHQLSFETFPVVFANLVVVYFRVRALQNPAPVRPDSEWERLGSVIAPFLRRVSEIQAGKHASDEADEVNMLWVLGKEAMATAIHSHAALSAAVMASTTAVGCASTTAAREMQFLTGLMQTARVD
eukprot:m.1258510 g.1258510  ORF g.1258510 m.1258510 type:complete len:770 (-) comp24719_c0_seq7:2209-4518(-)